MHTEEKVIVNGHIMLGVEDLTHMFGLCEYPNALFGELDSHPKMIDQKLMKILREKIWDTDAQITIRTLTYDYVDCRNPKFAVAYFFTVLAGTRKEIAKVFGRGKIDFAASKTQSLA